jgi:hypothetical protein
MPEILTESFCERCGTRYTFESAAPRAAKLSGIKVLSRGLKNFVMSDDTSMDEAMAAARSETDREVTSQQLDAFHKTFNFCMTCRQYTCGNCWNEAEGRCLTCAPHLGHEIMPAPFPDLPAGSPDVAAVNGANGHATAEPVEALAWPTMDLERDLPEEVVDAEPVEEIDALARLTALGAVAHAADDGATAEPRESDEAAPLEAVEAIGAAEGTEPDAATVPVEGATEPAVAVEPEAVESVGSVEGLADPTMAADAPVAEPEDVDHAAAAATQTTDLMRRFRPGQSLDAEIDAYEREQADARAATEALATAAAIDRLDEAGSVAEPDQVAPAVEAQPEPVAEATSTDQPEPAESAPEPARVDVVEQPTWRIVAPDADPAPPPVPSTDQPAAVPPVAAQGEPQWPASPEWPSQRPAAGGLPFLNRPAQPSGGIDALWAESAREVVSPGGAAPGGNARAAGGVEPCISCGLSLSATARFCRRCGTRQG